MFLDCLVNRKRRYPRLWVIESMWYSCCNYAWGSGKLLVEKLRVCLGYCHYFIQLLFLGFVVSLHLFCLLLLLDSIFHPHTGALCCVSRHASAMTLQERIALKMVRFIQYFSKYNFSFVLLRYEKRTHNMTREKKKGKLEWLQYIKSYEKCLSQMLRYLKYVSIYIYIFKCKYV